MQKVKYFKCPHCGVKFQSLQVWGNHVKNKHPDIIPEGWSYARYFYYIQTGKTHGNCVICKNPTEWNEATQKYERFCHNENCKKTYREQFKNRMISRYGKVHLLDDPEQQRKMLANKKISGSYTFLDGIKVTYTGTYELDFLKFLDRFLHFNGNDILMPSPHTYFYEYTNENDREHEGRHFYIPDAYIPSLNLEVEIKQGTNMHPKLLQIDKVKELQKDAMMSARDDVHYIKIVEKDYTEFIHYISELSLEMPDRVAVEATEALQSYLMNPETAPAEESITFEKYKEDYKPNNQKHQRLGSYGFSPLNFSMAQAWKKECQNLKHVRFSRDTYGELVLDKSHVVGYYNIERKDNCNWLQALEITPAYRGQGLAHQLIKRAVRQGYVTNLSVDEANTLAIKVYLQMGFHEYARNGKMIFMRLDDQML